MATLLPLTEQTWFQAAETKTVMAMLRHGADAGRFVGGCVRNSLIGAPVDDVDIATPLPPERVIELAKRAHLKVFATGLEHGTVTVVSNGRPFEITTLRKDVTTDGRRATVAFTADWREDALRRDFTINALYADELGHVHDFVGGLEDLALRRVRFIGDPTQRIAEDYLRILRLFRIHSWYGAGEIDVSGLEACRAARQHIATLSGERIQKEMLKLFAALEPERALVSMQTSGVLAEIVPGQIELGRLIRLIQIDRAQQMRTDPILRLGALMGSAGQAQAICARWRLSNADGDRLVDLTSRKTDFDPSLSDRDSRRMLYRLGRNAFEDHARLAWAAATPQDGTSDQAWRTLATLGDRWELPKFPIDGARVMGAGVAHGPMVGAVLQRAEDEWIDSDFATDPVVLNQILQRVIASVRGD